MKLISQSFAEGSAIPVEFAFGRIDPALHVTLADNRSPHLAWAEAPPETRSFAVICHDYDVPSSAEDVNQEGREVPATLPRVDFFHWLLIDLPSDVMQLKAGEFSHGVTPKGKSGPATKYGARQGLNDYTNWFAADADMAGDYYGYDGPCPPWNDSLVHHYVFTVFALDVDALPLTGRFDGAQVRAAMSGHVLAEASITATYTLNPRLI